MDLISVVDLIAAILNIISILINLVFITLVQGKLAKWRGKDIVYLQMSIGSIIISFGYLTYAIFLGFNQNLEKLDICGFSGTMRLTGFLIILFSISYLTISSTIELINSKSIKLKYYILGMISITLLFLSFSGILAGLDYFSEMPSKLYCSVKFGQTTNEKYMHITLLVIAFIGVLIYPATLVSLWIFSKSRRANFGVHLGNFESQSKLTIKLTDSANTTSNSTSHFMNYYRDKNQLIQHLTLFTLILIPSTMAFGIQISELVVDSPVGYTADAINQFLLILLSILIPIQLTITEVDYNFNIFNYQPN